MKRTIFILLILLLLCSCANYVKCDVPIMPPELSEISGKGITVTESFVEPEESGKYRNIGYTKVDFEIK